MIKIAICDDEKMLRLNLRRIIETELELGGIPHRISEFDCGEALLYASLADYYDIVFLDIEMKELDGVATAKGLREKGNVSVIIFVTSYPDFVFQGYEVRALNYILKPYETEKIREVLCLALSDLHASAEQFYVIEQKSGSTKLMLQDVKYIMSDRRSLTAVTKESAVSFYGKLTNLESELPDYFIRIHNRYLVNINFVTVLETNLVICAGESLPVSRSCKLGLSIAFAKYMLQ